MVGLAYLPDIAAQILRSAGLVDWVPVCHSIVLALPVALGIALGLRLLFQLRWRLSLIVALVSMALHVLLDVAVGHHRLLWWPFSDRPVSLALREAGLSMAGEMLIFGGMLVALLAVRWLWYRRRGLPRRQSATAEGRACRLSRLLAVAMTVLLFAAAAATQYMRDVREHRV